MTNKRMALTMTLIILLALSLCLPAGAVYEDMPAGVYCTLVDENNNIITQTGSMVYAGDEYISSDNSRYKVVEVTGNTAHCQYQGEERMPVVSFDVNRQAWVFENQEIPVAANKQSTVAVYHTHSDESYVPSDGKESKEGNGGIYDVGDSMVERLQQLGFNVQYSKNNHNPHDVNAYNRSRRTAMTLMKSGPEVVVDVHRDAVPPNVYQTQINGQNATKVKLVVGQSNPNMKTNLEFAKQIKAVMDKKSPGLSNGIFMGKGDYNQDLSPKSVLIEVGAHTNNKQDAEKGVALFADTLAGVMGVSADAQGAPAAKPLTDRSQGAWSTILIILTLVAAAGIGFYMLNRGVLKK